MYIRIGIFIFITALGFLAPLETMAQVDQRCWTQDACEKERRRMFEEFGFEINATDIASGFKQTEESATACGEQSVPTNERKFGFCLPAGEAVTTISIGGRNRFEHIGDFIKYIYTYGMVVASVLAVFLIIISGAQWAMSGGSSEMIGNAKKRITGSIIGLILLAVSYTILNLVNPYLVNLRMPKVWLVNEIRLAPAFCKEQESLVAFAYEQAEGKPNNDTLLQYFQKAQGQFNIKPTEAACQKRYFLEQAGVQVCRGTKCEEGFVCGRDKQKPENDICYKGSLVAEIYQSSKPIIKILAETWEWPPADPGETEFWGLCFGMNKFEINSMTFENHYNNMQQIFLVYDQKNLRQKVINECGSVEKFKGFFLLLEMDEDLDPKDEDHYIGKNGIDMGDDYTFNVMMAKMKPEKQHFFSLEEAEKGINVTIDSSNIYDVDGSNPIIGASGDELRKQVYGKLGF